MKDGGQAFPRASGVEGGSFCNGEIGMTLRDYFAAKTLGALSLGLLQARLFKHSDRHEDQASHTVDVMDNTDDESFFEAIAEKAYRIADAMLAEREKGGAS